MRLRRIAVALVIPAFVAGITVVVQAQEPTQTVSVTPVDTDSSDPNRGSWFFTDVLPGDPEPVTLRARLFNPGSQPQTVRLTLAEIAFERDGTPRFIDTPSDPIFVQGTVRPTSMTVGPLEEQFATVTLLAPPTSDAGDHVGALMVEHTPTSPDGGGLGVIARVATRIYATVPGDATRDVTIDSVMMERDSSFFTREVTLTVRLRNTGRIRLQPTVAVNDAPATGPTPLLTQAIEPYIVTLKVPFWGGPQRYRVDVTTRAGQFDGPARQLRVSTFIVPWHLLVLLVVASGVVYGLVLLWRRRGSRYAALQADMRRIERLLSQQAGRQGSAARGPDDPQTAIVAALKQARRAGNTEAEEKLKEQLRRTKELRQPAEPEPEPEPASGGSVVEQLLSKDEPASTPTDGALRAILGEIAKAPPERRDALVRAARSYGAAELDQHQDLLNALPPEVRVKLFASRPPRKRSSKGRSTRRP